MTRGRNGNFFQLTRKEITTFTIRARDLKHHKKASQQLVRYLHDRILVGKINFHTASLFPVGSENSRPISRILPILYSGL